ncbi:MAG: YihY/virulence factor BrkB family protein [Balneolales bacterium]|nr:YihY/virulence factor BrkB family protein [Balneolales bacterium]
MNLLFELLKEIYSVIAATIKAWLDDNMMLHAAGLAFYTIFSLAPLLIIIIALTGFIFGEQAASGQLSDFMEDMVGADLAEAVEGIVSGVAQGGSGFFATIVSTFILVFAATTVLTQLKESLNTIWNVDKSAKQPIKMFFINRFLGLLLILVFSATLILTIVFDAILTIIGPILNEFLPGELGIYSLFNTMLFLIVTTLLFSIIYKMLPDIRVKWSDVMVGAFVTALLFLLGRYVVSFYLNNAATTSTYGAAGSFVVFLIWVYYNVMVIFIGAEFTQIYTSRYGSDVRPGRYLSKKKIERN